jgi:hypothetical protein
MQAMSFIKSDKSNKSVVGGERERERESMGQVHESGHLEDENERTLLILLLEINCEDRSWTEMTQNRIQWQISLSVILNHPRGSNTRHQFVSLSICNVYHGIIYLYE